MRITYYKSSGEFTRNVDLPEDEITMNLRDDAGFVAGWFDSDSHYFNGTSVVVKEPKPSKYHVFDYDAKVWIDNSPNKIDEIKSSALSEVYENSSKLRSLYVTDIKDQATVYTMKRDEATRFLNDNDPDISDYPLIAAEIGITATTAYEVAQTYLNMSHMFVSALAMLENVRLTAVTAIETATTREAVENAVNTFNAAVSQLV